MLFLVLDANVIVSFLDPEDSLHDRAVRLVAQILSSPPQQGRKIIIPQLCIAEIVVVLRTKGLDSLAVETALRQFIDLPYVVVLTVSELQIHKFALPVPRRVEGKKIVRTSDYMVGVLARVLDGVVVTFDHDFDKICNFCKCAIIKTEADIAAIDNIGAS